jgi:23S rRNA (cytidine1920-2'-O)/16S rRNA (cytidine1409-2'-O)-methyltransferase
LDVELVRRGLAVSRDHAQELISDHRVLVAGSPVVRPGTFVAADEAVAVAAEAESRYVSRGGQKLEGALDRLDVGVDGRRCLDAGASTGGFTDVLLARGAAHVVTVDVGYGQLAWSLRTDDRVTVLERTNVRDLDRARLPYAPELVTADLSFISLATALPALVRVAAGGADLVLLVKPQFEAPAEEVERGGLVRDPATWRRAIVRVADAAARAGAGPRAAVPSPLPGAEGNVEFFLHTREGAAPKEIDIDEVVTEAEVVRT